MKAINRMTLPAAMDSWGIHSGVASLEVEMSWNRCDCQLKRQLYQADRPASSTAAPRAQTSMPRRADPFSTDSSKVTRMCSPRLSVWASARKPAPAIM